MRARKCEKSRKLEENGRDFTVFKLIDTPWHLHDQSRIGTKKNFRFSSLTAISSIDHWYLGILVTRIRICIARQRFHRIRKFLISEIGIGESVPGKKIFYAILIFQSPSELLIYC